MKRKILIIKLGYSETLHSDIGNRVSLGDVLRTTVILNLYRDDMVTWLTSAEAMQLLEGNPYVERVLQYNTEPADTLLTEEFDVLVNLEKIPEICRLTERMPAAERRGFGYSRSAGEVIAYPGSEEALRISGDRNYKRTQSVCCQEFLFRMVGTQWQGEPYVLRSGARQPEKYDIALNWAVGKKWPNKEWARDRWEALVEKLEPEYSVSWQTGLTDLRKYIEWINQCRLMVTSDSLGLHAALALGKKVVALFGPTNHHEIWLYGQGEVVAPKAAYPCIPCLEPICRQSPSCMETIGVDEVVNQIRKIYPR